MADDSEAIRLAAFDYLNALKALHPDGALPSSEINAFSYAGKPMRLIVQTGIWKPAGMSAALSIRTTFTGPNELPPYEDDLGDDGLVRYKYRGTDPESDFTATDGTDAPAEFQTFAAPTYFVFRLNLGFLTTHIPLP